MHEWLHRRCAVISASGCHCAAVAQLFLIMHILKLVAAAVQTVIFVHRTLSEAGYRAVLLHGKRSQQEREAAVADFKAGKAQVGRTHRHLLFWLVRCWVSSLSVTCAGTKCVCIGGPAKGQSCFEAGQGGAAVADFKAGKTQVGRVGFCTEGPLHVLVVFLPWLESVAAEVHAHYVATLSISSQVCRTNWTPVAECCQLVFVDCNVV